MLKQTTEMESKHMIRLSNQASKKLSQECIEKAMISLMEKKSFEEITISELVKKAGVSRAAFYRNYETKQDVLLHACRDAIDDVSNAIATASIENNKQEFFKDLFEVSAKYADGFLLLVHAGFGQVILHEITLRSIAVLDHPNSQERYNTIFWCGAVYNTLLFWMADGMKQSIDTMCETGSFIVGHLPSSFD